MRNALCQRLRNTAMAIRAVVFDLGGVLLNEIETGIDAKWEALLNLPRGELNQRLVSSGLSREAGVGKFSEEVWFQKIGELYGMGSQEGQQFLHEVWDQYVLNADTATYFSRLRSQYRTVILSNAWPEARREAQARFNLDAMTDLIIYSYEVETCKPEKRIFEILCERLGLQPGEI